MTKRNRRDADSMSYTLSRWYRRISEMKPSSATIIIIVLAVTVFILGGGVFQVISQTPLTVYNGQTIFFLFTRALGGGSGLDNQLGMDVVISAMLYTFGIIGLLMMYQSTKSAYKPRNAYLSLITGASLIAFAYVFLEVVIAIKSG
ncbi:MAG: hypothetical protein ACM3WQ_04235 [Chloroflexota bacterium]